MIFDSGTGSVIAEKSMTVPSSIAFDVMIPRPGKLFDGAKYRLQSLLGDDDEDDVINHSSSGIHNNINLSR